MTHVGQKVTLAGWMQGARDLGGLTFIDLRDRYGLTQLTFNMETDDALCKQARGLGREYVLQVIGEVRERENKNLKIATGEIEIIVSELRVLNESATPPFTIEDETDGGEDLRMKYRYLDIRRNIVREKLELRHRMAIETRSFLDNQKFMEIETPVLIKSTPEGARDFVVPSRLNQGQFYALPQSPQTFKQLLMVGGCDRYFQLVKCFRDEDLRADRQPEFTQIDCEMSFVDRDDILETFEALVTHLFKKIKDVSIVDIPRMSYDDAMKYYGSDKPDTRFEMKIVELKANENSHLVSQAEFKVFDEAAVVLAINASGSAIYTRKQLDELTEWVKERGMSGLIYARIEADGSVKSSVDKFYNQERLQLWAKETSAIPGDLILILCGGEDKTRKIMGDLRLEMGQRLGLRDKTKFSCLWVLDFPLVEWSEEDQRWYAMHHPFTSPIPEHISWIETNPGAVKANAYDLVINGWEIGGGSIRIHDRNLQSRYFKLLGFSEAEAQEKFGFLLDAFKYGAPPHGGIAFGFDRLCALFGGADSIRDFIAFPKNNSGRDVMIDAPGPIDDKQRKELGL